jgi:ferredoxin
MATIFCFSSTGNSLYAAKRIAGKIDGDVVSMSEISVSSDDTAIGFIFPVYFWGLPRIVERFIKVLQIKDKEAYVFAVATYGGVVRGVLGRVKRLLTEKGVSLRYGKNLKMVENYIPRYKLNDSEAFRRQIDENIDAIAAAVRNRENNRIQVFTPINTLINKSYPDQNSDRYFTVADSCSGCAICQRVCPAGNIEMEQKTPVFRHQCEHCLACVHNCPVQAINWKHKTEDKGRFLNHGITLDELMSLNQR